MAQTGHEFAHKTHASVLSRLEAIHGTSGLNERVPGKVKETFALLVEKQVREQYKQTPAKQVETVQGGEWQDVLDAVRMRRQAPYALTQRLVRAQMEELWTKGVRNLSDNQAERLLDTIDQHVSQFYEEGVAISWPGFANTQFNTNITYPIDGEVYITKYLADTIQGQDQEAETDEGPQPPSADMLQNAFQKRFGTVWIDNQDARVVLLSLMAISGENHNEETYSTLVENADIEALRTQLHEWGMSDELI